jgi:hypothetical protein
MHTSPRREFRAARFPGTRKDDNGGRFPGSPARAVSQAFPRRFLSGRGAKPRRLQLREQPQWSAFPLSPFGHRLRPTLAQRGYATMPATFGKRLSSKGSTL